MKKFLSLVLASALTASMAAVSFADLEIHNGIVAVDPTAHRYSADGDTMIVDVIQYGKAAYYALLTNNDPLEDGASGVYKLMSDSEMVDGLRIRVEYEQGRELVAENGVALVKKRITSAANSSAAVAAAYANAVAAGDGEYYYFIEMQTVAQETTTDDDIIATFTLSKSRRGNATYNGVALDYKVKDLDVDIATNVGYENSYLDSGSELAVENDVVGGSTYLNPETYYLLKYNYDDAVEFTFGTSDAQNEGTFTVDVSGQGKNLLYFDTLLNDAIVAANPGAQKLYALNFNNTRFNRTGEFVYEGEDFAYAYQLMEDGTLNLLGEFDGDEVIFRTRVLGSYLFSDVELVAAPATVTPEGEPVEVDPVEAVVNPGTGAAL